MLKTWKNGDKAEVIQAIIENNFKILGKYLSNQVLALSTQKISELTSDYFSDNTVIYDTTQEKWLINKSGVLTSVPDNSDIGYVKEITESDWTRGASQSAWTIVISQSEHKKRNPVVQLYIQVEDSPVFYSVVSDGVFLDADFNVTLRTDIAFKGKVVIR